VSDATLDATFLIDLFRRDAGAWTVWNRVIAGELTVSYSPITVLELWLGTFTLGEEQFYEDVLLRAESVPLGSEAAKLAATWLKRMRPVPERIVRDALIAASAAQRGEPIYTRNRGDFERFTVEQDPYAAPPSASQRGNT
jgi:predicted nucleic acid-binding protein